MTLLTLPNELILLISEQISSERDLNALWRASRHLYILLNPNPYLLAIQNLDYIPHKCIENNFFEASSFSVKPV